MLRVISASAGSGKTYALVKDYLKIVLASDQFLPHKQILAVTFTNKAVDEMKERIIEALICFSNRETIGFQRSLFNQLKKELNLTEDFLILKSKDVITKILHNYGGFQISTIDTFNQRLIRSFAFDLKLPLNFEVELNTDFLLEQAVESVLAKVGGDSNLTDVLVDFAISKTDQDRSWNIALDLCKFAQLLVKETAIPYLESLRGNNLENFISFKNSLKNQYRSLEKQIRTIAEDVLASISKGELKRDDFNRRLIPSHFEAIVKKPKDVKFDSKWKQEIESFSFYNQKASAGSKSYLDDIRGAIISAFFDTKKGIYRLRYLQNIIDNITPLSVLALVQEELNMIKQDQNIVLISEFNTIIADEIKSQPAPFIYEKIGEKYKHFFIDEFQDTSLFQWENLKPLIENSLADYKSSVLLAGDPKQSIYRWRGGHPEQFIKIINGEASSLFTSDVIDLPINYRSSKSIVDFNNKFFSCVSEAVFSDQAYKEIYKNSFQEFNRDEQGLVEISFLNSDGDNDQLQTYESMVLSIIADLVGSKNNISYEDICILVRKQSEGVSIAKHLTANNVPIVSNQSLLVSSSKEVIFIIAVFKLITIPSNQSNKLQILNYLVDKFKIEEAHEFIDTRIQMNNKKFFNSFRNLGIYFNCEEISMLSIYESAELVINSFGLVARSNAYIESFLNFIFESSRGKCASLNSFLLYFDQQKEKLSISTTKGVNAVQVMTVHKSKGLEFPVLIFPYADLDIYKEIEPKEWMPTSALDSKFPYFLLNYNKDFEFFGDLAKDYSRRRKSLLELDNINLLYVALTRPSHQLYIITKAPKNDSPSILRTYSDLFVHFLKGEGLWKTGVYKYSFGLPSKISLNDSIKRPVLSPTQFISFSRKNLNISISSSLGHSIDDLSKAAIDRGNLLHQMLSKIFSISDIEHCIEQFCNAGSIDHTGAKEYKRILSDIVTHSKINQYYLDNLIVFNEKQILDSNGRIIIPDRLIISNDGSAVIIDYKTGRPNARHRDQLECYTSVVKAMGYNVDKKILVYIYPKVSVKVLN